VERAGAAELLLLTDADIVHAPGSLRHLVCDLVARDLVLTSRMALLRATALPERLLIPAFGFFFACLYPMRWVGKGGRRAAAAGGCILVRADALAAAGGMAAIRGEIIDDVNLARALARVGRIRLATSRRDVRSIRAYDTVGPIWRMVRRTAFDQLRYSRSLLALTVLGLLLLFVVPPAVGVVGAATGRWLAAALAFAALGLLAGLFVPTVRHFGLGSAWVVALPIAGVLYGAMTVDSAFRHARGRAGQW
jgi:hopene-associated glycosyltransferase HpnB